MNECDTMKALVQEHLDRTLSSENETRLASHLLDCSACREELSDMERAFTLFESMPVVGPSVNLAARIMAEIGRSQASQNLGAGHWWNRIHWVQGAVSICLLIYLIVDGVGERALAIRRAVIGSFQRLFEMAQPLSELGQNLLSFADIRGMFYQWLSNLTLFNSLALLLIVVGLFWIDRRFKGRKR